MLNHTPTQYDLALMLSTPHPTLGCNHNNDVGLQHITLHGNTAFMIFHLKTVAINIRLSQDATNQLSEKDEKDVARLAMSKDDQV